MHSPRRHAENAPQSNITLIDGRGIVCIAPIGLLRHQLGDEAPLLRGPASPLVQALDEVIQALVTQSSDKAAVRRGHAFKAGGNMRGEILLAELTDNLMRRC